MNVLTVRINAWQEARSLADGLPGWIFRGQQDASWGLSTALERAGQQSQGTSFLLSKIEEQIIEEFQRRAHHFLPDPPKLTDLIEWRSVIQHFGGPTRLPDFTGSFYVAAFFAAEKATKDCAIWYVNHNALYKSVGRALGINIEDLMIPYYRVSHQMVGLAQRFIGERQAPYHQFVFEVQPFRLNERAAVQQGVFLCPLSVDLPFMNSLTATFSLSPSAFDDAKTEDYDPQMHTRKCLTEAAAIKLILPLATLFDALEDLWRMNVTAATLFPGLDGFARSLHYLLQRDNLLQVALHARQRRPATEAHDKGT